MEYFDRKRLAEMGFTTPLSSLPGAKVAAFLVIDRHLDRLRADKAKRKQPKKQ